MCLSDPGILITGEIYVRTNYVHSIWCRCIIVVRVTVRIRIKNVHTITSFMKRITSDC